MSNWSCHLTSCFCCQHVSNEFEHKSFHNTLIGDEKCWLNPATFVLCEPWKQKSSFMIKSVTFTITRRLAGNVSINGSNIYSSRELPCRYVKIMTQFIALCSSKCLFLVYLKDIPDAGTNRRLTSVDGGVSGRVNLPRRRRFEAHLSAAALLCVEPLFGFSTEVK